MSISGKNFSSHIDSEGHPVMVDVSDKSVTSREAVAEGFVILTDNIAKAVLEQTAPKGEVLKTAELAGIMSAKHTPDLIPLCHPIRLDNVRVECSLDADAKKVTIRAFVKACDVTGVEMEALTAVSVAALTIYDMCKGIDKGMTIEGIRLLRKSGGKSGDYYAQSSGEEPAKEMAGVRAAVLTVSDKGAAGERVDTAGPALRELLESAGAEVINTAIVPDEREAIADTVKKWSGGAHLILTTGGTGLSMRDVTPEALNLIADRTVPGFGEVMRSSSLKYTPNAPLSRGLAVTCGSCLIVAMPGSERGARQCFEIILPSLRHAIGILNGWDGECGNSHHIDRKEN